MTEAFQERKSKEGRNTNYNHPNPLLLKFVSAGLRGAEWFSQGLALRWASRLLHTAHRRKPNHREKELFKKGTPFWVPYNENKIFVMSWGSGPAVLLVHGWNGNVTQLSPFIEPLLEQGYRVVALDGPAHGQSSGKRTDIVHFAAAVFAVAKTIGSVQSAIGYSLGGSATVLASQNGLVVERLALISTPICMKDIIERFSASLKLSRQLSSDLVQLTERKLGQSLSSVSVSTIAPNLKIPTLIVHDREDVVVPYEDGEILANLLPDAQLVSTTGLGHRHILYDRQVIQEVIAFIA
ncbi:MAG: alpha/beta hydrolase [Candidatus Hodarchaeota archaeon]